MVSKQYIFKHAYASTIILPLILTGISTASAAKLEGYATQNGGTTGGQGGKVVYASTGKEIHEAMCERASDDTPLIIYVSGTINHGNTEKVSGSCDTTDDAIQFKRVSNISLIGTGSGALFDEIGIHVRESSNLIIQNLHIRNVKKSGSPTSNGGDAIGLETDVHNIWIDHNRLEASGGEKDGYDSLLDMKAGTKYVTASYNYFHDSGRGGLVGSSDSDDANNYITFHHNYYKSIDSRLPLLRHATAHAYNNYYEDISKSGMNPRIGGKIKAENNHFKNANNPIGTFYTDDMGSWDVSGNKFEDVTWNEDDTNHPAGPNPKSTTSINIPYAYTLHDVNCVKDIVTSLAGNKSNLAIAGDDCESDSGPMDEPDINVQLSIKNNIMVQLDWSVTKAEIDTVEVYRDTDNDLSGRVRIAALPASTKSYTDTTVESGKIYFYSLKVRRTDGKTFNSDPVGITVPNSDGSAPAPTIALSALASGSTSINLNWSIKNADITQIALYRDTDAVLKGRTRIAALATSVTNYTDTNVSAGTAYYYSLKVTTSSGQTFNTDAVRAYTSSNSNNAEPNITLSTTSTGGTALLNWTINGADIDAIAIYRDTDSNLSGRTKIDSVPVSDTTYIDSNVSAGSTYYYSLKVRRTDGTHFNSDAISVTIN